MRISDWSSDVCSSDLIGKEAPGDPLIACIPFVAQHFGQNFQRGALSALARDERGFLPFHQAEAALDLCLINNERLHARKLRHLARELPRSEEHTSELQSLMRISYAVFCLKKTI